MRKALPVGVAGVALVGAALTIGGTYSGSHAQQPTSPPEDTEEPSAVEVRTSVDDRALRQLSQRVNQLQIDQAALRAQLEEQRDEEQTSPAEDRDNAQLAAEQAEMEARDRARTDNIARAFDVHLEQEAVDEGWAEAQEAKITATFADPSSGNGKLLSSRCAATLCKVELLHPSAQAAELFVVTSGMLPPFLSSKGFYRLEEAEGGVKMAFYAARAGHELPPF